MGSRGEKEAAQEGLGQIEKAFEHEEDESSCMPELWSRRNWEGV